MPLISLTQLAQGLWWSFDTTWGTVSYTSSTWVIAKGDQTLTFTAGAGGFTAPRFAGDIPGGVVASIELKYSGASAATLTGLSALGATPSDIMANSAAILSGADTFSGSAARDIFWGYNGDDSLSGGDGDDYLEGDGGFEVNQTGNDTLDGGGGNDYVDGGLGANLVLGGAGDDILRTLGGEARGGDGNDTIHGRDGVLRGGEGADTINASGTPGVLTTIYGDGGDDRINVFAGAGPTVIDGGDGVDVADVTYSGGTLTRSQIGNVQLTNVEQVELTARSDISLATLGPVSLKVYGAVRVDGSAGDDTVSGPSGAQTIAGGMGDDVLDGGSPGWGIEYAFRPAIMGGSYAVVHPPEYDIVDYSGAANGVTVNLTLTTAQATGQGNDTLIGFEGVIGSAFNDVIVGALGDRKVYGASTGYPEYLGTRLDGGAGNDQLTGTVQADTLVGGAGNDTLVGNGGGDVLNGGAGSDFMTGGGVATFGVSLDGGVDTITDFSASTSKLLFTGGFNNSGVITWNKATRQLLWDADGDAGAGAARVVAELGGGSAGTLSASNLDEAFRPAVLRTIAPDGTVTEVQLSRVEAVTGGPGADVLIGGPGADTLQGFAGADVFDGRGGVDVITGGTGADKFHLLLDGNPDRITDFNSAEGDFILVVEDASTIASGVGGLLIYDTATRTLAWDSDSDAGPSAAVAIAQFDAGSNVNLASRGSYAAGFQPSGLRLVNADGSKVEVVFDWGTQAVDHSVTGFNAAGRIETFDMYFDNGSWSNRWWDVNDTESFDSRVADYDSQGRLTAYGVYLDDGSHYVFQFDTQNLRTWDRLVEKYDPLGRLTEQGIKSDDGTGAERIIDTYDVHPWAYYIDNYDAVGRLLNHTFYKADGTVFTG